MMDGLWDPAYLLREVYKLRAELARWEKVRAVRERYKHNDEVLCYGDTAAGRDRMLHELWVAVKEACEEA